MYLADIQVTDSIYDPDAIVKEAKWRFQDTTNPFYRVFLYLDGPALPFVESVVYLLHPTFADPTRRVFPQLRRIPDANWSSGPGGYFACRRSSPISRATSVPFCTTCNTTNSSPSEALSNRRSRRYPFPNSSAIIIFRSRR